MNGKSKTRRRLMTISGVDMNVAMAVLAAIGGERDPTIGHLASKRDPELRDEIAVVALPAPGVPHD